MGAADLAARDGDLLLSRHAAFAVEEAPHLHQRPDGDVEGAARVASISERRGDECKQLRVDTNGMRRGFLVDAREWARQLVVTHQPVDAIDLVESLLEYLRQLRRVRAVRLDRVRARHRHAARLVTIEMWSLETGRGQ